MNIEHYLQQRRGVVDKALDEMLPGEENVPELLHRAMRYSVFAGGKRIRPILAMAAAEAVAGRYEGVEPLAVALECIHTYSLIHDDLPAMDDDDLRRGKPTAHKVFGEAIAILAGDALLTFAFSLLASPESVRTCRCDRLVRVIGDLAFASGSERLIAGQALDILNEGRSTDASTVNRIIRNKTAALIRASLTCGATIAGAEREEIGLLADFGDDLGAIFQIRDDLLDLEGDPRKLGKAVKKDGRRGKATYPRLLGLDATREIMRDLVNSASEKIRPLGRRGEVLATMVAYIGERSN